MGMSAKVYAFSAISDYSAQLAPKLDYLKELSGGDQAFINEILEMFITEAPQSIENAINYLREKNYHMLKITVLKLKSSVQVVGGYHLTNLIQEIENASVENASPAVMQQTLSKLKSGISHVVSHLGEALGEFNPVENTDSVRLLR
jgi:HPt (histidine-containing phosphotransfer) domain-containing protein